MAKTNFTKAEEALANALEQMKVGDLLEQADRASGKVSDTTVKERTRTLHALQRDLNKISQEDKDFYKKLKVKRKDLQEYLEHASTLTNEEWEKLLHFKEQVDAYLKQKSKEAPSDEQIIASQRKKHITKRFNVSEKWLPLK